MQPNSASIKFSVWDSRQDSSGFACFMVTEQKACPGVDMPRPVPRLRPRGFLAAKAGFEYTTLRRTYLWILSQDAFGTHRSPWSSLLNT